MTDVPRVLVVGAAGMLGGKIVKNLLGPGNVRVRALLKSEGDKAAALRRAGVEVVVGDLLKPETLDPACDGVRAIIAAVALGDRTVVVDGQTNLIRAAERAAVERMIPSDYSVDYFKLDKGDNYNLDMRREVSEVLTSSHVKPTFILNGGFSDVMLKWGPADYDAKTFSYWGEDDQECDFTASDDVAAYVARAALDPAMAGLTLRVAGEVLTMLEFKSAIERASGRRLRRSGLAARMISGRRSECRRRGERSRKTTWNSSITGAW